MATFSERFQASNLQSLFVLLAFPINAWSIFQILRDAPSWAFYMDAWELAGTVSYMLAFTLLEAVILFLPVAFVGMLMPSKWSERFIAITGILILISTGLALVLHGLITKRRSKRLFAVASVLLLALGGFLGFRYPRLATSIRTIAERLSLLTGIYVVLDLAALVLVVARNL